MNSYATHFHLLDGLWSLLQLHHSPSFPAAQDSALKSMSWQTHHAQASTSEHTTFLGNLACDTIFFQRYWVFFINTVLVKVQFWCEWKQLSNSPTAAVTSCNCNHSAPRTARAWVSRRAPSDTGSWEDVPCPSLRGTSVSCSLTSLRSSSLWSTQKPGLPDWSKVYPEILGIVVLWRWSDETGLLFSLRHGHFEKEETKS